MPRAGARVRMHQELRDQARAASACLGASRTLCGLVHGTLPPRMVDARLHAFVDAVGSLAEPDGLLTATPGHVRLVASLGRHIARDVVDGHVRSTRANSPGDADATHAEAVAGALAAALDHLSAPDPSDAPDWCGDDAAGERTYGPSHGDVLGPTRVMALDCLGMLGAGPREAALASVHARRMVEAVTVLSLVLMDGDPLDAAQVDHVTRTFEGAADHLDAIARNWTRLDPASPGSRLGHAVRSSVELVREPVLSGLRADAPTANPGM